MRNGVVWCIVGIIMSSVGCTQRGVELQQPKASGIIYTYGDASYERKLQQGEVPMKWGAIPAEHVAIRFPEKFLEPDGSYGGGRVYRTIEEAEAAILEAENNNILSRGEARGVYQVEGDWDTNTYELHPNDYRLRASAPIIRKVN